MPAVGKRESNKPTRLVNRRKSVTRSPARHRRGLLNGIPSAKIRGMAMTRTTRNHHSCEAHAAVPAPRGHDPSHFDWPLAYEAEKLLRRHVDDFLARNSFAAKLAARMRDETATEFFEWVDHLVLSPDAEAPLLNAGLVRDAEAQTPRGEVVLVHPRATLPRVRLRKAGQDPMVVAIKPEFVADFVARNPALAPHRQATIEIEGDMHSRYRRAMIAEEDETRLEAIERRAYQGFLPAKLKRGELEAILAVREFFQTRLRHFADDADGFIMADRLLTKVLKRVNCHVACHLFFGAERACWESRNRAGRVQKTRQDTLGLGWGNHDHHTFRCSRAHFANLVRFLERLGLQKRERFYAGAEAGWGAQVMEQPATGIVVFADVDLTSEETEIDFSVRKLPPARQLGTVGLWVGLHGESFLQAGMHHLEARFDFTLLRDQLRRHDVDLMEPFSDFEFLRQAFTEGERWSVSAQRAKRLAAAGLITRAQCEQFIREGAIGSHLENLQRHGGFKGFNQKAVSAIISATDPRRQPA